MRYMAYKAINQNAEYLVLLGLDKKNYLWKKLAEYKRVQHKWMLKEVSNKTIAYKECSELDNKQLLIVRINISFDMGW